MNEKKGNILLRKDFLLDWAFKEKVVKMTSALSIYTGTVFILLTLQENSDIKTLTLTHQKYIWKD